MTRLNDKTLSLTPGKRIELYDVDLAVANGPILRFTPNREDVTPAECYRIGDTRTNATDGITAFLPVVPAAGEVLILEGFARHGEGATCFPAFQLSPDGGATSRDRVRLDLNNLATSQGNSTPVTSDRAYTLSQASEWVYFACRWTMGATPPATLALHILPAMGTTYPTEAATAVGTVDFFGLRFWIVRDGLRIPVVMDMDLTTWAATSATMTRQAVANTAEAVKVPVWQGNAYTPIPIRASGFEKTGNGAFPKPKLVMSNITGAGSLLMQQYGDIRGATVKRTRMYADHLDNGPEPDPAAFYTPDVFTLVRRSQQDAQIIEFELASKLDQQGVQLPRRQILRDVCPFVYRRWNPALNSGAGGFDYTAATCPYSGPAMFDIHGEVVTNGAEDVCSHTLALGCRKRYGTQGDIPFGGFPMVGRFRR